MLACFKESLVGFLHFLYRAVPLAAFSQVLSTGIHTHSIHIQYWVLWAPQHRRDMGIVECVQPRARKVFKGKDVPCLQGVAGSTVVLQLRREGSGASHQWTNSCMEGTEETELGFLVLELEQLGTE